MGLLETIARAMPPDTVGVHMTRDTKNRLMLERDSMRLMSFGKPIGTDMTTVKGRSIELDPHILPQTVIFVTRDNAYTFSWKYNP